MTDMYDKPKSYDGKLLPYQHEERGAEVSRTIESIGLEHPPVAQSKYCKFRTPVFFSYTRTNCCLVFLLSCFCSFGVLLL